MQKTLLTILSILIVTVIHFILSMLIGWGFFWIAQSAYPNTPSASVTALMMLVNYLFFPIPYLLGQYTDNTGLLIFCNSALYSVVIVLAWIKLKQMHKK